MLKVLCRAMLGLILCLSFSTLLYAQPTTLRFKKPNWPQSVLLQHCQQIPALCTSEQHILVASLANQNFILAEKQLYLISNDSKKTQSQHWDLSHLLTPPTTDELPELSIFLRLFPVDAQHYAIAIIKRYQEMYSGGGATIEYADFYQLNDDGSLRPLLIDIPFNLSRMIRACFSDTDFEQAQGQCHDLEDLRVAIGYVKPMQWRLTYSYQSHVSPASDSEQTSRQERKNYLIQLSPQTKIQLPAAWSVVDGASVLDQR